MAGPSNAPVVERDEMLKIVDDEHMPLHPDERSQMASTLGFYSLTMVVRSHAKAASDLINERLTPRSSERQGRLVDPDQVGYMNKKKREG
jgi:sulfate adenylyltransferase subunit 2